MSERSVGKWALTLKSDKFGFLNSSFIIYFVRFMVTMTGYLFWMWVSPIINSLHEDVLSTKWDNKYVKGSEFLSFFLENKRNQHWDYQRFAHRGWTINHLFLTVSWVFSQWLQVKVSQSCPNSLRSSGLYSPWNSPGSKYKEVPYYYFFIIYHFLLSIKP